MTAGPIGDDEIGPLFTPLSSFASLALAVSGGADSMALMLLVARWLACSRDRPPPRVIVLTVDHGLRPESAAEAAEVAAEAGRFGFAHRTLTWLGDKPATGRQAAARAARYRLLAEAMASAGCEALVTAHTADDQAETLLMRLARGSGVDGLAAIAPAATLAGVRVLRPLLRVSRLRLVATLAAAGVRWIEDPSNADPAYERVRLRQAAPLLAGLGLTAEMLAMSAGRLERARLALDWVTESVQPGKLAIDPSGVARIEHAFLQTAPEELGLRLLQRALDLAGEPGREPQLGKLEAALTALRGEAAAGLTLHGAQIQVQEPDDPSAHVLVWREHGRGLPELMLAPGETAIWDGRFRVRAEPDMPGACQVRPLQPLELADLKRRHEGLRPLPHPTALTVPSFWREGACIAVPALGCRHPGVAASLIAPPELIKDLFPPAQGQEKAT